MDRIKPSDMPDEGLVICYSYLSCYSVSIVTRRLGAGTMRGQTELEQKIEVARRDSVNTRDSYVPRIIPLTTSILLSPTLFCNRLSSARLYRELYTDQDVPYIATANTSLSHFLCGASSNAHTSLLSFLNSRFISNQNLVMCPLPSVSFHCISIFVKQEDVYWRS